MKKLQLLLGILLIGGFVNAQFATTASLGAISKTTPQFGFNTVAHLPAKPASGIIGANWTQQWFIDSTATLGSGILRFPGGTNANHWDWKTGWYKPGYQPQGTSLQIRVEEFKPGLLAAKAEGLYVVNLETSNPTYEMEGIRHADLLGLNFNKYELGNEHNLYDPNNLNQAMTAIAYAQLAKPNFDSIIAFKPNAKVCAVGGNTSVNGNNPNPNWNNDVISIIPNIHAFAFHVYLTANNADLKFDVNRALAVPYAKSTTATGLEYRYQNGGFASLPLGKEVWVTEFNLDELQVASSYVISKTWTHLLYLVAKMDFFLSKDNITMIVNHGLAGGTDHYESISRKDKHITANGIAMKLIGDVAKGSLTCQNIIFSGNNTMTSGTETIPKIIGWKFNHSSSEKALICNYSSEVATVSLSSLFPTGFTFDQYSADPTFVVQGLSSLNKYSGNSSDSVTIAPFSFTQVVNSQTLGVQIQQGSSNNIDTNGLWIYPNPSQIEITIQTNDILADAEIMVYNTAGQEVRKNSNVSGQQAKISTVGLTQGIYFITIKNGNQFVTGKFIVD